MTAKLIRQEEQMKAKPGYQDITLPVEKRVDDLVWRMTLEEKVSRMVYDAPSIERLGVAFVKGLQGDDQRYLKLVATPKHYAVHSGPARGRRGGAAICERYCRGP